MPKNMSFDDLRTDPDWMSIEEVIEDSGQPKADVYRWLKSGSLVAIVSRESYRALSEAIGFYPRKTSRLESRPRPQTCVSVPAATPVAETPAEPGAQPEDARLSVLDVAVRQGVCSETVRRWIRVGLLKAVRVGGGLRGRVYVYESELKKMETNAR